MAEKKKLNELLPGKTEESAAPAEAPPKEEGSKKFNFIEKLFGEKQSSKTETSPVKESIESSKGEKTDDTASYLKILAENTMSFHMMGRDINVARQNVQQLVKIMGGETKTGADEQFKTEEQKGKLVEERKGELKAEELEKKKPEPVKEAPKKKIPIPEAIKTKAGSKIGEIVKAFSESAFLKSFGKYFALAAILGVIFVAFKDTLVEWAASLWTTIKEKFTEFVDSIKEWFKETIQPIVDEVKAFIGNMVEKVGEFFKSIGDWLVEKFKFIADIFEPIVSSIKKVWDTFMGYVDQFKTFLKPKVEYAMGIPLIGEEISKIVQSFGIDKFLGIKSVEEKKLEEQKEKEKKEKEKKEADETERVRKLEKEKDYTGDDEVVRKRLGLPPKTETMKREEREKKSELERESRRGTPQPAAVVSGTGEAVVSGTGEQVKAGAPTPVPTPVAPPAPKAAAVTPTPAPAPEREAPPAAKPAAAAGAPAAAGPSVKPTKKEEVKIPTPSGDDKWIMEMIKKHEGVRTKPYKDSLGLWTVGVGHLIGDGKKLPAESGGIQFTENTVLTNEQVDKLFAIDYEKHKKQAEAGPGYDKANEKGKAALIDLAFNMGGSWFKKFKNAGAALAAGDFQKAADELQYKDPATKEPSAWFQQVKGRAATIVAMVREGMGGAPSKVKSKNAEGADIKPISAPAPVATGTAKEGAPAGGGSIASSVTLQSGVDISGVHSDFIKRLSAMAADFKEKTGKKLLITSGFRSNEKQKELWDAKVKELGGDEAAARKWVAEPMPPLGKGKGSFHLKGLALDINSKGDGGINKLAGPATAPTGWLESFGLTRPVKNEDWHVQPVGLTPTPDNPNNPGAPIQVAGKDGKPVDVSSGKKETAPTGTPQTKGSESGSEISSASTQIASGQRGQQKSSTPVVVNSPTTNNTVVQQNKIASASAPQTSSSALIARAV